MGIFRGVTAPRTFSARAFLLLSVFVELQILDPKA